MLNKKISTILLILIIVILPATIAFTNTQADTNQDMLKTSWNNYKSQYIQNDGAVRRPDQGNDVVSEGVAYAMMRAVWMNDQSTFDKVYNFTEKNLSRKNNKDKNDNLLAWRWNGGVIDWGAASDADLDYALALAFASKIWSNPTNGLPNYKDKSIAVQKDILAVETGWVGDKVYLQPGTWYAFKAPIPVNPSYLSPAYYKIFDQMSPDPRWNKLVDTAYEVVWKSSRDLDGSIGVGLPADWVQVNDGQRVSKANGLGFDYKYDAFRTSFRFALDYVWFGDLRAKDYLTLSGGRNVLLNEWKAKNMITAEYSHDGHPMSNFENAGAYGANMGWFMPENKDVVNQFVGKIQNEFNKNGGKFFSQPNYYMENWAWLGLALGTNNLPNLYNGGNSSSNNQTQALNTLANISGASPMPTVSPTPVPTKTPIPTTTPKATVKPSSIPTPTITASTSQALQIVAPSDGSTLNGRISLRVKNTYNNNQGTWWSVDSGGWVNMYRLSPQSNEWVADIDISNWNWREDKKYTLHAWTKESNGNQVHTQIVFYK
jgi:endoglucanase